MKVTNTNVNANPMSQLQNLLGQGGLPHSNMPHITPYS